MSNSLAIATVTATLRHLLEQGTSAELPGTIVTTKPPEKARDGNNNQLNVFLYQTAPNAAWRNQDLPNQVKPGETGQPPLALNLFYLITTYGQNEDDLLSHQLLGQAMSVLHDHAVLDAAEIKAALSGNDLHEQIERVRITPQPMPLEEMSKLWMMLQAEYRISAAYQVDVVLIDSRRPVKTPLPVLTRGSTKDEGVVSQPDLTPPFPTLLEIGLPNQQPSARLGDVLTIVGHNLDGATVRLQFISSRLANPIKLPSQPDRSATELKVQLPNNPTDWVAGFYTVVAVIQQPGQPDRTTNELSFSIAPRLETIVPNPATPNASGDVTLTLTCSPQVRLDQRVSLLLGDREILAQPRAVVTDPLVFNMSAIAVGEYFVRLRVDGVDSLLVNRTVTPPVFDPTQKVTIQ